MSIGGGGVLGVAQAVLNLNTAAFTSGLNSASGSLRGFASQTTAITQGLDNIARTAGIFGGAIAAGVGASIKLFADFERNMANVNAVINDMAGMSLKQLSDAVLDLSIQFARAPEEMSSALYDIAQAGYDATDSLAILDQSTRAATAGMTDVTSASKLLIAVLQSYGEGVYTVKEASDLLFQTVLSGNTTFAEMSRTMSLILPTAKSLGIGLDEVGAALSSLTLQGFSTRQATQQLNGLFNSLIKPSKALAQAYRENGIESGKALIEAHGLAGALVFLSEASGGSDTKLKTLVGTQTAFRAVLALTNNEGSIYKRVFAEMATATEGAGATQEVLSAQMETTDFAIRQATTAIQVLATELGATFAPVVSNVAGAITGLVQAFRSLPEPVQSAVASSIALIGGLSLVVAGASKFASIWLGVTRSLTLGSAAMGATSAAASTTAGAVSTVASSASTAIGPVAKLLSTLRGFLTLGVIFVAVKVVLDVFAYGSTGGTTDLDNFAFGIDTAMANALEKAGIGDTIVKNVRADVANAQDQLAVQDFAIKLGLKVDTDAFDVFGSKTRDAQITIGDYVVSVDEARAAADKANISVEEWILQQSNANGVTNEQIKLLNESTSAQDGSADSLGGMGDAAEGATPQLDEFGNVVETNTEKITEAQAAFNEARQELSTPLTPDADSFKAFNDSLDTMISSAIQAVGGLKDLTDPLGFLQQQLKLTSTSFANVQLELNNARWGIPFDDAQVGALELLANLENVDAKLAEVDAAWATNADQISQWEGRISMVADTIGTEEDAFASLQTLLDENLITQQQYYDIKAAGIQLTNTSANALKDEAVQQALLIPEINKYVQAHLDAENAIAGATGEQQAFLSVLQSSEAQQALNTIQTLKYLATIGQIPESKVTEVIADMSAANPEIAALFDDLGILAQPVSVTVTANISEAERALHEVQVQRDELLKLKTAFEIRADGKETPEYKRIIEMLGEYDGFEAEASAAIEGGDAEAFLTKWQPQLQEWGLTTVVAKVGIDDQTTNDLKIINEEVRKTIEQENKIPLAVSPEDVARVHTVIDGLLKDVDTKIGNVRDALAAGLIMPAEADALIKHLEEQRTSLLDYKGTIKIDVDGKAAAQLDELYTKEIQLTGRAKIIQMTIDAENATAGINSIDEAIRVATEKQRTLSLDVNNADALQKAGQLEQALLALAQIRADPTITIDDPRAQEAIKRVIDLLNEVDGKNAYSFVDVDFDQVEFAKQAVADMVAELDQREIKLNASMDITEWTVARNTVLDDIENLAERRKVLEETHTLGGVELDTEQYTAAIAEMDSEKKRLENDLITITAEAPNAQEVTNQLEQMNAKRKLLEDPAIIELILQGDKETLEKLGLATDAKNDFSETPATTEFTYSGDEEVQKVKDDLSTPPDPLNWTVGIDDSALDATNEKILGTRDNLEETFGPRYTAFLDANGDGVIDETDLAKKGLEDISKRWSIFLELDSLTPQDKIDFLQQRLDDITGEDWTVGIAADDDRLQSVILAANNSLNANIVDKEYIAQLDANKDGIISAIELARTLDEEFNKTFRTEINTVQTGDKPEDIPPAVRRAGDEIANNPIQVPVETITGEYEAGIYDIKNEEIPPKTVTFFGVGIPETKADITDLGDAATIVSTGNYGVEVPAGPSLKLTQEQLDALLVQVTTFKDNAQLKLTVDVESKDGLAEIQATRDTINAAFPGAIQGSTQEIRIPITAEGQGAIGVVQLVAGEINKNLIDKDFVMYLDVNNDQVISDIEATQVLGDNFAKTYLAYLGVDSLQAQTDLDNLQGFVTLLTSEGKKITVRADIAEAVGIIDAYAGQTIPDKTSTISTVVTPGPGGGDPAAEHAAEIAGIPGDATTNINTNVVGQENLTTLKGDIVEITGTPKVVKFDADTTPIATATDDLKVTQLPNAGTGAAKAFAGTFIAGIVQTGIDLLVHLGEMIVSLQGFLARVGLFGTGTGNDFNTNFTVGIVAAATSLDTQIAVMTTSLNGFQTNVNSQSLLAGQNFAKNIGDAFTQTAADVDSHLATMEGRLDTFASAAGTAGTNSGTGFKTNLIDMLAQAVTEAANKAQEIETSLDRDMTQTGRDVGASFGSGMVQGIDSYVGLIADAAARAVNAAEASARDAAISHSPSELFAAIGKDLDEGLALGIERYTSTVVAAGRALIEPLGDAVIQSVNNSSWLNQLTETIPAQINEAFSGISTNIAGAGENLFDNLAPSADSLAAFSVLTAYFTELRNAGADVFVVLEKLPDVIREAITAAQENLRSDLTGATADAVDTTKDSVDDLNTSLENVSENTNIVIDKSAGTAIEIDNATTHASQSFDNLGNAINTTNDAIPIVTQNVNNLGTAFDNIIDSGTINAKANSVSNSLSETFARTAALISTHLVTGIEIGSDQMVESLQRAANQMIESFGPLGDTLKNSFLGAGWTLDGDTLNGSKTNTTAIEQMLKNNAAAAAAIVPTTTTSSVSTITTPPVTQINNITVDTRSIKEMVEMGDFFKMLPVEQEIAVRRIGAL